MTTAARIAVGASAALVIAATVHLVAKASAGESDISVYYRTCRLLRDGAGAAIYRGVDAGTGWPISMPPIGFAIFQPFSTLSPLAASIAWGGFNVAMLVIATLALRDFLAPRVWGWTVAVLLTLATASIQVGQFSVLFTTCWILFMHALARDRMALSAMWLAIPGAIKLYPILLLGVPVSAIAMARSAALRRIAVGARYLLCFLAAIVSLWIAVPALTYGAQAFAMNHAWWQHVILNNAQMDYLQSLRSINNQSLDTMLLRYLSYDPSFHDQYPSMPHLAWPKQTVLQLANIARLVIVVITSAAVARVRRMSLTAPVVLAMTAAWSSALYMVLPEIKPRYAVYVFLALVPWIARAVGDRSVGWSRAFHVASIGVLLMLLLGTVPDVLLAWGAGFVAPLLLWTSACGRLRIAARESADLLRQQGGEAGPASRVRNMGIQRGE